MDRDSDRDRWFMSDLRGLFRLGPPPFLYGVGSWFGPGVDSPTPLLLVDQDEISVTPFDLGNLFPGGDSTGVSTESSSGSVAAPSRVAARVRVPLVVGRPREVSSLAREALRAWLGSAVVIPTAPPDPLVNVGSLLFDSSISETATVGVPVERTDAGGRTVGGFLTAGHATRLGSTILSGRKYRWDLRPRRAPRNRLAVSRRVGARYGRGRC